MNNKRVLYEMNNGTNVCHPSALPNTKHILSVVNSILLPHRLIVQKDNPKGPKWIDPSSLEKTLANKKLSGGITPNRYTEKLNNIINDYASADYLYKSLDYSVLAKMILHNRLDYIIEYSPIISYISKLKSIANDTTSLRILENQKTPFLLVHVACPNTNWGRMMINKINKILVAESKQANFHDFRMRWYDTSSKKLLEQYYNEEYFKDK